MPITFDDLNDDDTAPRRWKRPARTVENREAIQTSAGYTRKRTHPRGR